MAQTIVVIVLIAIAVFVFGVCGWLLGRIRTQNKAAAQLAKACPAYEKNAKLQSDFRVIRHDFANYVQAAGAAFYENDELRELVRAQKRSVRGLVEAWNMDADLFWKEHEGSL